MNFNCASCKKEYNEHYDKRCVVCNTPMTYTVLEVGNLVRYYHRDSKREYVGLIDKIYKSNLYPGKKRYTVKRMNDISFIDAGYREDFNKINSNKETIFCEDCNIIVPIKEKPYGACCNICCSICSKKIYWRLNKEKPIMEKIRMLRDMPFGKTGLKIPIDQLGLFFLVDGKKTFGIFTKDTIDQFIKDGWMEYVKEETLTEKLTNNYFYSPQFVKKISKIAKDHYLEAFDKLKKNDSYFNHVKRQLRKTIEDA